MPRPQTPAVETENSPPRSGLVQQPSSAAAAALNDKKLLKTKIAAAVGCSGWFGDIVEPMLANL